MYPSQLVFASLIALISFTSNALTTQPRDQGLGIQLTNSGNLQQTFYFYKNFWEGDGTAGVNFDSPNDPPTTLAPGASTFVDLPTSFKGRVQRGNSIPATWVEFQVSASDDNAAHGDVSLEQGCDGAATISSTDGSNVMGGFTNDVLSDAPVAALFTRPDGVKAIASTMGNWIAPANQAAVEYLNRAVGQSKAYITGGPGVPDIASKNNVLAVVFY